MLPLAREIEARLRALPSVAHACAAGSVRRCRNTIGDLNFIVASGDAAAVSRSFASFPQVARVRERSDAKTRVRLHSGMEADLRVVPEASFGAALLYFTGSAPHNAALRRIAQRKRLELNESGLFRGRRRFAGRTEVEVYEALGLTYVPPVLREDAGEIEAARAGELPALIQHGDLRGDLRVYTDGGVAAIESMARAARAAGLEYFALNPRPHGPARTPTDNAARMLEHAAVVRAHRRPPPGFRVLAGAEVAIRPDGSLAVSDAVLAQLDVVGAAVYDHLDQPRAEMTRRIVRAVENPHVDILVHPAARPIGGRKRVSLDIDAVIAAAKRTRTVLEIDARPEHLELDSEDVRKALDAGVGIAIDSGAEKPEQLGWADEFGIAVARRGWARRCDVLNAVPVDQCLARLKGRWGPSRDDGCS